MTATHSSKPFRVGLTGGIASGKSTVAGFFAECGVPVIDTDVIARDVVAPGQPALDAIRAAFGDSVIGSTGELDRSALRRLVFADDRRRHELEAILHPRIRDEAARRSRAAGGPYQLIVVPLLVGSPMREDIDRVLVVDLPEALQLSRLLARDGDNPEQARRMIAAQASREERLAIADDVIVNDGHPDAIRERVARLHEDYLRLAGKR